jgi:mycothiol synthase
MPLMTSRLEVRQAHEGEALEIASLLNALSRDLYGVDEFLSPDVASWIRDPESRILVAVADQELVGWAEASPGGDVEATWWLDVLVPPHERQREIMERLVQEAEDIAHAASPQGMEAKFYLPEADAQLRTVVRERGYQPVSYSFRMERRLDGPPEGAAWPLGINVRAFRPGTDETPVYELQMETNADQGGTFDAEPFERWCERNFGGSFDASLWFVAEAKGKPVGLCLCRPELGADRSLGWVSFVGVRRRWRRQGLGLALLLHAFEELYRRGVGRVGLGVHGENPTGATRLYERAGMKVARRYDHYAKHLKCARLEAG